MVENITLDECTIYFLKMAGDISTYLDLSLVLFQFYITPIHCKELKGFAPSIEWFYLVFITIIIGDYLETRDARRTCYPLLKSISDKHFTYPSDYRKLQSPFARSDGWRDDNDWELSLL